jgi:hypothetical protein
MGGGGRTDDVLIGALLAVFDSSGSVLPVTFVVLPSSQPPSIIRFASRRDPPAACMSTAVNLPDGLRSASTGTPRLSRSKSSRTSGTPASWAMASRCSTALVEPPVAATDRIALANACGVSNVRGRRFAATTSSASAPMASAWSGRSCAVAGVELDPIGARPRELERRAMVLAVNWPPRTRAPGRHSSECRAGRRR